LKDAPGDSRRPLAELQRSLSAQPPQLASAMIREILHSGADAPTQLDFKVGPNGLLSEAPSLRVFLLDYLAQLDRLAAGTYAEKILQTQTSADEWAVSLRNYALANPTPEGKSYLVQKVWEMIQYQPWQKEPSTGFLEAFDVIVYAGGSDFTPLLAELVRQKDNRAVAHAAYLTLDRLVLQDPAAVLAHFEAQPDLMNGRETTRANYFARADVGDVQQKAVLESYLLNPQITGDEIKAFADLYPNANYMVSNNLLTPTQTPGHAALVQRDQKALEMMQTWLADPRFADLKPHLETIKTRLELFVKQTAASSRGGDAKGNQETMPTNLQKKSMEPVIQGRSVA